MFDSQTFLWTCKLLLEYVLFKFDMNDCWPTRDLSGSPTFVDFFGISPLLPFRGFSHLQQENIIGHRSGIRYNGAFVFSGVLWWWGWCLVWSSVETTQELETEVHSSPHSLPLVSDLSLQLLFLDPFPVQCLTVPVLTQYYWGPLHFISASSTRKTGCDIVDPSREMNMLKGLMCAAQCKCPLPLVLILCSTQCNYCSRYNRRDIERVQNCWDVTILSSLSWSMIMVIGQADMQINKETMKNWRTQKKQTK